MRHEDRLLNQYEAATATALEVAVVRLYAESGLIAPRQGYGEADLAELRRLRRTAPPAAWVDAEWSDIR